MVTAVANVLTEISGVGARGTNSGKAQSEGDSAFAQLLDGMGGEATPAASIPVTDVAAVLDSRDLAATDDLVQNLIPMLSAEPIVIQLPIPAKSVAAATASVSAHTTNAVLLAVGTPKATQDTAQASTPIPALIAADTQAPATINAADASNTATLATATTATPTTPAALSDPASTAPVDLQWLRAMTGAARAKSDSTAADAKLSTARISMGTVTDTSAAPEMTKPLEPGHDLDSASSQSLIQMLAQTAVAPMMIAADLPRQDRGVIIDMAATTPDTSSIAPTALQPAGTALADAATALNSASSQHLRSPVGGHEWATELGNKLTMMATRDTQSATLYMTPADLGPVQVRIDMHHDQASVWFTAEHAETRSALEQALPKLREMFTAQGMSLTDAGVFGNRSQQQQPQSGSQSGSQAQHAFAGPLFGAEETNTTAQVRSLSLTLLDAYA